MSDIVAIDRVELWTVILLLGLGSYGLRFTFLGAVGDRPLPEWLLRYLRYTAVTVLPALIAPLILWPAATGGAPDPARLIAAFGALAVGYLTRHVMLGIVAGFALLYLGMWLGF